MKEKMSESYPLFPCYISKGWYNGRVKLNRISWHPILWCFFSIMNKAVKVKCGNFSKCKQYVMRKVVHRGKPRCYECKILQRKRAYKRFMKKLSQINELIKSEV